MKVERLMASHITSRRDFLAGCSSLAAVLLLHRSLDPAAAEERADLARSLTDAFASMGSALYSGLSAQAGNIVFSPYSIGTAMAMVLSGARGSTEQELAKVLQLRLTRSETEEASAKVMAILKGYDRAADPNFCPQDSKWTGSQCEASPSPDRKCRFPSRLEGDQCVSGPALPNARLLIANALMLAKEGGLISPEYIALIKSRYAAELFTGVTVDDVNRWVREKTNGKIPKILDSLGDDPAMVLLNAVYFKAAWSTPFSKAATKDDIFHVSANAEIKTPTMHREGQFRVIARPGYRAIQLPYAEQALSMVIVLPDRLDGLSEVASSLGGNETAKMLSGFEGQTAKQIMLALPRFKNSFDVSLVAPFKAMGLQLAFSNRANFSGMTGKPAGEEGVKIDQILHRAVIEIMEEGTEAAAATAVTMVRATKIAPEPTPEPFIVDRPFLFFVADAVSGAILFQGRVLDPSLPA